MAVETRLSISPERTFFDDDGEFTEVQSLKEMRSLDSVFFLSTGLVVTFVTAIPASCAYCGCSKRSIKRIGAIFPNGKTK